MSIALIDERKSAVSKSERIKRPIRAIKTKTRLSAGSGICVDLVFSSLL